MRFPKLVLASLLLFAGLLVGEARADKTVRLTRSAPLRARPGERAPTITKLSAGQTVRVVGQKGRWLQVNVGGRVGWITRTQAEQEEETEIVSRGKKGKKEAKGKKKDRAWDALDEDAVGGEIAEGKKERETPELSEGQTVVLARGASVRRKPSARAAELYTAEQGDEAKVLLLDEEGEWLRIEDADGGKGWVAAADVSVAGSKKRRVKKEAPALAMRPAVEEREVAAEEEEEPRRSRDVEDESPPGQELPEKDEGPAKRRSLTWFVSANGAFLARTQRFTSAGTGVRANYGVDNSAPAVLVGGQLVKRFGIVAVGAEAWYLRTLGGSGIAVDDGATMGTLDFRSVAMDGRLLVGVDLKGVLAVARAGYHRDSTYVTFNDYAMLPDEKLAGFTVGAALMAPRLTSRLGAHAAFDMLLAGKLEQDSGARDGTETKSVVYYGSAGATMQLVKGLEASLSYAITLAGFGFAGPSDREASATDGRRKDRQHLVSVGARYSF